MRKKYKIYGQKMKKKKLLKVKQSYVLIFLLLLVFGGLGYYGRKLYIEYKVFNEKVDIENDPEFQTPPPSTNDEIPSAKVLAMPYTVQAPFANWAVHDESCEEAALLMYHYFLKGQNTFEGKTEIPPQLVHDEEVKMKNWQVTTYGKEPDLTIDAWGKFAQAYYGYKYQVFSNITKEDIQEQIAKGSPVVVPVMTHSLDNPHYGAEDSYHVVVLKGYKEDGVIANDPGIKQGENYFYAWEILFKAMDAQSATMKQGRMMATLSK